MISVTFPRQRISTFLPLVVFGAVLLVVCILSGLLAAVLPWWFVIALFVLPLVAILAIVAPELGLVFLLLSLSGVLPQAMLPELPLGPGRILASDLVIFALIFVAAFKLRKGLGVLAWDWFKPIFWLLALSAIAIVVGKFIFESPVKDVLQEARIQINWMIAPLVLMFISNRKRLNRFSIGIVLVGLIVAVAVVFQFATGKQIIANARVEELLTLETRYTDVTRSTAGGGIYFVLFSLLYVLALLFVRRVSVLIAFPVALILAAGIIVSFGRGIWIATAFAALLMAYFVRGKGGVASVIIVLSIAVSAALVGLAAFKPQTLEAAYERIVSTTKEGAGNSSLGWRFEEAGYAFSKIVSSPLVGIGYGTPYKPLIRLTGSEQDVALTRYIHNGYLGLWLKLGISGLLVVLWFSWRTYVRGLRMTSQSSDSQTKALAAALTAGFTVPVITSMTQPEWLAPLGVAYFAMTVGLLSALDRLSKDGAGGK
ncbi:O-antigen ligase [Methyloversatilis sp.]|uniref:O-antigen ligase family protein n=1 Tax=Methyloversatilis sp. TaxID=2569862 RepID=UPI002736580D|nr:O-antigen ligase family protein [Methyloversatilis sp.]MDP3455944.1 O-antigen ligase family protein [Methyloversatilis sp.]